MSRRQPLEHELSRRERQLMDAIHALGEATAHDVVGHIAEPEAYHSVRVTLGILEKKGYLRHRQVDNRNVYQAVRSRSSVQKSAMQHLARTFFGGSASKAILAFLDQSGHRLTQAELDEIAARIDAHAEEP
jgi:predicted transcriptional regulator